MTAEHAELDQHCPDDEAGRGFRLLRVSGLVWQHEAIRLSRDLHMHLGTSLGKPQQVLLETLLVQTD